RRSPCGARRTGDEVDVWEESLRGLADRLARQGGRARPLSARTQVAYLRDARLLARWLRDHGVPAPTAVSASALEAAFRDMAWSAATRARALTSMREWLGPLFPPGRSPADLVERPRHQPPPVPRLSQADAAA